MVFWRKEIFMEKTPEQFLTLTRKQLYQRLHALARPLSGLTDVICTSSDSPGYFQAFSSADPGSPYCLCATDGCHIFWNFRLSDSSMTEACLLHQVIHCLFGHPFSMPLSCRPEIWSLACDISAWHILNAWIPELLPNNIGAWLTVFSKQVPDFPLYQTHKLAGWLTEEISGLPVFDSHRLWPAFRPDTASSIKKECGGCGGARQNPASSKTAAHWKRLRKQLTSASAPLSPEKKRSKKSGMRGEKDGNARRPVTLTGARRYDYRNLLKSLARWGEEIKINDDEFQYASYLYGLEHYNGMPLLEPLEYRETAKIRELAIVIDTSASCSHSLTQIFLEETRNLLLEEDLFFHPFNLHILQCDKEVKRDDILTSPEDLKDYIETLEIIGMGGTDFCPAFAHIRHLQDCHEFSDLPAILFFTDGSGLYPSRPPGVRTIFIFLKGHYEAIDVPDWAEILILEMEEMKG